MIPREELAAIKELHDIAEAINHDCDTRGCAQCEDDNCRAVRYIPRLLAEVERLRCVELAAEEVLAAWDEGWDCGRSPGHPEVDASVVALRAALDAAEGG